MPMRAEYKLVLTIRDKACILRKVKSGSKNLCGAAGDAFRPFPQRLWKASFQKNLLLSQCCGFVQ